MLHNLINKFHFTIENDDYCSVSACICFGQTSNIWTTAAKSLQAWCRCSLRITTTEYEIHKLRSRMFGPVNCHKRIQFTTYLFLHFTDHLQAICKMPCENVSVRGHGLHNIIKSHRHRRPRSPYLMIPHLNSMNDILTYNKMLQTFHSRPHCFGARRF